MKKGKTWTEKQIQEKIKDLEDSLRYKRGSIERIIDDIRDQEILLQYYKDLLKKRYNNPSDKHFGGPQTVTP